MSNQRSGKQFSTSLLALLLFLTAATAQAQPPAQASASPPATQNQPSPATQTTDAPTSASPVNPPATSDNPKLSFMTDEHNQSASDAPSSLGLMARTLGALLLIVGLIVGVGWGLRRFGKGRFATQNTDAPELSVLSTTNLGERRALSVVRFGERILLVGSTAQSMTLLATEDLPGETNPPAIRSVADLLGETEARSFGDELLIADERFKTEEADRAGNESAGEG